MPAPGPAGAHGAGAVPVLDIGGEVGALVVYLAAAPATGELEACPAGRPGARFHTGVHPRPLGPSAAPVEAAVFPALVEGAYDLLDEAGAPLARVEVAGGAVAEVDLRRR